MTQLGLGLEVGGGGDYHSNDGHHSHSQQSPPPQSQSLVKVTLATSIMAQLEVI